MENGNLQDYLDKHKTPPDQSRQLAWFRDMARASSTSTTVAFSLPTLRPGTFSSPPTSMLNYQTLISQLFCHLIPTWRRSMTPAILSIPTLANLAPYFIQSRLGRRASSTSSKTYPSSRPTPSGRRGRISPARRTCELVPLLKDVGPRPHSEMRASF